MRRAFLLAALLAASGCVATRPDVLCAHLEGAGDSSTDALDPVHQGDAVLHLDKNAIRFSIVAPGLETVTAAHIHHGQSGTYGPMLWEIHSGFKGDSVGATASDVPPGVIALIARDPADYYVKLHAPAFPGGAIRGQLGPSPPPPAWSETFNGFVGVAEVQGTGTATNGRTETLVSMASAFAPPGQMQDGGVPRRLAGRRAESSGACGDASVHLAHFARADRRKDRN